MKYQPRKSKLRLLMEAKGISCKDLAARIGVKAELVSKWRQSDRGMPSLANLEAVCAVLGCNPVDIFPEAHNARGKRPCRKCGVIPDPVPSRFKKGSYICNPCSNEYRRNKNAKQVYSPASTYGRPGVGVDEDLFFNCSTPLDERPPGCTGRGYAVKGEKGECAECMQAGRRVVYF